MARRKQFAVVDVAQDCLHTVETAMQAADLEGRYPPGAYLIVDMDGKDDVPFKEGATLQDLTVDEATGEWVWKVTDTELQDRLLAARHDLLRHRLLSLMTAKEKAESQGPDFAPVALSLQDKIAAIENELAGL